MMWRRKRQPTDFNAEIEAHIELETERLREQGLSEEEARQAARRAFGNLTQAQERFYESGRWLGWDHLRQDVRYSLRALRRSPGFLAVALLTLALGIGANTTIFSLVNAVLLRPLPGIEHPDRLVLAFRRFSHDRLEMNVSYPNYKDWRDQNQVFSGLAAYKSLWLGLSTKGESERAQGAMVSGNYFDVLGVKPALGRTFLPEEDRIPGARAVAVVSYGLWKRRFGANAGLAGGTIQINGHPFTVVGVAGDGFKGTETENSIDVWVPMMMEAEVLPRDWAGWMSKRDWSLLQVIGRLKSGVGLEEAQANMDTVARQLEQAYPKDNAGQGVRLLAKVALYPWEREKLVRFGALLMAVVGLVLLIACANVANLLLTRASTRQKEIAVRLAIGASRARLMTQLLTESLLLALLGGALGLLGAAGSADVLSSVAASSSFLPAIHFAPDGRVLGFTALISLLTGVLFGLAPAYQASGVDPTPALKEAGPSQSSSRSRLQQVLVVSQIALSLVLLTGAGLLVRTLRNYLAINPGFEMKNILDVSLDLGMQGYTETQGELFYKRLLDGVRGIPGVQSASLATAAPLAGGTSETTVVGYGRQAPPPGPFGGAQVKLTVVAPDYFRTLGISLAEGRDFTDQDSAEAPRVAIINQTTAQRLWPGEDPLAKQFAIPYTPPVYFQIVGVVKDSRIESLGEAPGLAIYLPLAQQYDADMTLLVRAVNNPVGVLPAVRRQVQSLDRNLPAFNTRTLSEEVGRTLSEQKISAALLGIFASLALVLAAIGIYGVTSYSVARRTHEIGIRMALGAERSDVLQLLVGQGFRLTLIGVAVGIAGALALTRFLSSLLYGVKPTDLVTFILAPALLTLVALLASYIPARRATKVDPLVALRYE